MIVRVCPDLIAAGLDVNVVREHLVHEDPRLDVGVASTPCADASRWLPRRTHPSERFVLAVCHRATDHGVLEAALCEAGGDPRAVIAVVLTDPAISVHAQARALLLLDGAIARVRAHTPTRPENLRPVRRREGALDRRAFLSVPRLRYETIAAIRGADCVAPEGCAACVVACPHRALRAVPGAPMAVEAALCTGCGACVSACPEDAIDLPGSSARQIDAQVRTLLSASAPVGARGIEFVCERTTAARAGRAGDGGGDITWLPVEVPCVGMVSAGWLLAGVAMGAAATAARACDEEGCRVGPSDVVGGRMEYCGEFLRQVGRSAGVGAAAASLRGGARGAAAAVLALAGGTRVSVAHRASPLGVVDVVGGCTGCGACVQGCIGRALALDDDALTFDACRCLGCGECRAVCPEQALSVARVTDVARLASGRVVAHRVRRASCRACGAPVAPAAMLERIATLLRDDPVVATVARYCTTCRVLGRTHGPGANHVGPQPRPYPSLEKRVDAPT